MSAHRGRLARWGPALVALTLALAAYAPALRPDRQLAGRDLLLLFEPLHRVVAAGLRQGRLPERDALRGAGTPLVPDPLAQVFYPPALLRALLPFDLGWALWFPLHAALAGAGAGHLARRLGATSRGACLAAAGAALAGPVLSACRTPNLLAAAAWTPWLLAALLELTEAWRPRALALAGLALGMSALAGGAPLLVILAPGLALLLVVAARGVGGPAGSSCRWARAIGLGASQAALAAALGAALAAAHLLPFVLWKEHTLRAGPITGADAAAWALHPRRLLELVTPGLTPQTSDVWFRLLKPSFGEFGGPLHASVHLGLPVVLLAALALFGQRARERAPTRALAVGGACVVWLLIALGPHTPVFGALRALPLFDAWRYPEKALLPIAVALPALAGTGLRALSPRLRAGAFVLTALLGLVGPLADRTVLFTLPRALLDDVPLAKQVLADAPPWPGEPRGRFLRLARPRPIEALGREDAWAWMAQVRAGHIRLLHEDLPGRHGIPALLAYPPMVSARLKDSIQDSQLDLARLADDACVSHVLLPDRTLKRQEVPRRARLEGAAVGGVEVEAWGPERMALRVHALTAGALYVSEGFLPGWRASVDGEEVAVSPARIAFLSLPVPAGTHRVVLEYRTPGLWPGALLSAAALVALVALARRRE